MLTEEWAHGETMNSLKLKSRDGFTLIELMIVVVIIGILAAIAIPNFISMQARAEVVQNANTVQVTVEDYAVRNEGRYPLTVSDFRGLLPDVDDDGFQDLLENPYTGELTEPRNAISKDEVPGYGQVFYKPILKDGVVIDYEITGFSSPLKLDKHGQYKPYVRYTRNSN